MNLLEALEATLRLVEIAERNSWLGDEQLEHGVLLVDERETAAREGAASLLRQQPFTTAEEEPSHPFF